MGRTLRKNLKKYQMAPYMIYILRKWKNTVENKDENLESFLPII